MINGKTWPVRFPLCVMTDRSVNGGAYRGTNFPRLSGTTYGLHHGSGTVHDDGLLGWVTSQVRTFPIAICPVGGA
jgi:hypothetical protein